MDQQLEAWNLQEIIPIFKENNIDLEAFQLMSEDDIKKIVTSFGLQIKLISKWKLMKQANEGEQSIIFVQEDILDHNFDRSSLGSGSSKTFTVFPSDTNPSQSESNLHNLLNISIEGKEILQTYQIRKLLKRRQLVDLIIKNELKEDINKRITKERFLELSLEICKIFPEEYPETYYIAAYRDSRGKPISAHGKLWDKYINLRGKFQDLKLIPKRKRGRTCSSNVEEESDEHDEISDDVYGHMINYLKISTADWSKVEKYWRETSKRRLKTYNRERTEIHRYFKNFPALCQKHGYQLLSIDFSILYPEKTDLFVNRWPTLCTAVLNVAKYKKCDIINRVLGLFRSGDTFRYQDETIALFVLPLLFPNTFRGKKNVKKYSKSEMQENFIYYVQREEDFQLVLDQKQQQLEATKETEQPFVYVISNDTTSEMRTENQ